MEKEFVCKECGKKYLLLKSLRRHVLQCHEDKLYLIPSWRELKTFKFECDQCDKGYNQLKHLTFHKRKVHGHEVYTRKIKTKCPFCEEHFLRNDIEEHLQNIHGLSIEKISLQFESYEIFLEWKLQEEEVTKSKFIKKNGTYKRGKKQAVYFHCHRSGYYIPEGKGIRHLKTQGSNKINGFCPAEIKVSVSDCGEVKVTYIKTHIGHQNDLEHLIVKSKNRRKKSKITSPEGILKNKNSKNTDSYCNSIKSNMCAHVQVIDQLKKADDKLGLSSSDNEYIDNGDTNLSTDFPEAERIEESNIFVKDVSRKVLTSDSLKRKKNIITQFANLVNEASEEEEIKYLEHLIIAAKLTIKSIENRNSHNEESILKSKMVPPKAKNVIPQTLLFILRKPTTLKAIEKEN